MNPAAVTAGSGMNLAQAPDLTEERILGLCRNGSAFPGALLASFRGQVPTVADVSQMLAAGGG